MQFGGHYLFGAPRLGVWQALNDTEILKAAIPGCTRIDWISETELEAEITVRLGLIKPTFTGGLILSDIDPAVSYTLSGHGKGGVLGLANGAADITLADHDAGTLLGFTATGGASGQIMKLGRKIVGSSAQKVIDHFFERFAGAMGVEVTPINSETDPQSSP